MTNVRVIVVDDEALARERISALVRATPRLTLLGEASNGLEALDLIESLAPDLVLLDVDMPELSGFDVVASRGDAAAPGFVFITAYDEYAIRAFEVDAVDYLLKPVSAERFAVTVDRALARLGSAAVAPMRVARAMAARSGYRTRFVVRRGSRHTFVAAADVAWIDVEDNYLQLHVGGRPHLVRGTMKDAEQELDPAMFLRIHRSAMVNVSRIAAIDAHPAGYSVRLTDGTTLRTSRQYAAQVRALLQPFRR